MVMSEYFGEVQRDSILAATRSLWMLGILLSGWRIMCRLECVFGWFVTDEVNEGYGDETREVSEAVIIPFNYKSKARISCLSYCRKWVITLTSSPELRYLAVYCGGGWGLLLFADQVMKSLLMGDCFRRG